MMQVKTNNSTVLALDVGDKRIGVAIAGTFARLPRPLATITNDQHVTGVIKTFVEDEQATAVVLGLPRGMDGQETEQTLKTRLFGEGLKKHLNLPIYYQDEAVTSKLAESELLNRGKQYNKAMVDALAATYILEDFLNQHPEVK